MDREAWRAVAHRIAKSRAWLRCLSTHTYTIFNSCDYSGILLEHILKKRWKLHFHRCVLTLTFFFSLKETPIDNNVAVSNWAKEWWMKQSSCEQRRGGLCILPMPWDFPHSSVGKESACNAGDLGSIPALLRSPGEGKGYPLQYSGLENFTDCIVHGVAKNQTRLSDLCFHFQCPVQL